MKSRELLSLECHRLSRARAGKKFHGPEPAVVTFHAVRAPAAAGALYRSYFSILKSTVGSCCLELKNSIVSGTPSYQVPTVTN
eukprot:COSAG02_NODE_64_length_43111_cov_35.627709_27_plen_83_part_00